MHQGHVIVFTTTDSEQHAGKLAHGLVETHLAACVQIESIRSVYRWQGQICDDPEWRLSIKTTAARYPQVEQFIRANHSYQTPEIVRVQVAGGSDEYLQWIDACVP